MTFDEIMEFNKPYNSLNYKDLVEQIKKNNIIPFIGAGMSVLFEGVYPIWGIFLNETYDLFLKANDIKKFEDFNYEEKADFLYENIGALSFSKHLKKTFSPLLLNRDRSEFESKPIYLLPIIFKNNLIVTTNYDQVIEKMYQLHEKTISVVHPGHHEAMNSSLRSGSLLLFKIHGDINEPRTSIILTKEQYEKAYEDATLISQLKRIFESKQMLFLGCSLEKDRPIEFMKDVSEQGMENYAIISCCQSDLKKRRLGLENDYYIRSIIYPNGKHECLHIILNQIVKDIVSCDVKNDPSRIKLSCEWFIKQNEIQIKNLGNRYLPELNVELELRNTFDALAKNEFFYRRFREKADKVLKELNELKLSIIYDKITEISQFIENYSEETNNTQDIDFLVDNLNEIYKSIEEETKKKYKLLEISVNDGKYYQDNIRNLIYKYRKVMNLIDDYICYLESNELKAVNIPYILIEGDGGIGKSHLIGDIIEQRNINGNQSLLFLGQHFKSENNPLKEMIEMLELDCNIDVFLNELNKFGEQNQSRIIIFIDALNEGNGKNIWKNYLGGIVEKIKPYSWIALVMSIRTDYIQSLLGDNDLLKESIVRVKHKGFFTIEYDAVKKYFDFYNIKYTDYSFSYQEFRNPLFLRLFCEGNKNKTIDVNSINFIDIYKNYLNTINFRISEACNYSQHINIVKKVIKEIVSYKYNKGRGNNLILLDDFCKIIIDIEKEYNIHISLLDALLSEGILTQNIDYNNQEYVYVTYEKLEDYLYAGLLVDEITMNGIDSFQDKYLHLLNYEDVLGALAIVLAENTKYELFDIYFDKRNNDSVIRGFINGLKWRMSKTITKKTLDYINEVVLRSNNIESFYDVLILNSIKIGHQLNAEITVNNFLEFPMPDRDAFFIPLFNELLYEEGSSINLLLDWCLSNVKNNNVSQEIIRLTAVMVSTFLISSNRYLRDKSTKALIKLLEGHIDILILVLKKFEEVDDPYILERLYAIAFGCVVAESSEQMIEELAKYVYEKIFKPEYVYPNILLRDYAKNIVDYAKYKNINININMSLVRPPYKSILPKVPTDEEIEKYKYDYQSPEFQDYYWGQNNILSSMRVEYSRDGSPGGYGDFGRYVFQSYFYAWENLNYNDLENIAIKKIFDMGYDVEKHGQYDIGISRSRNRNKKTERIGKKYQWIALYELAAQVSDNYKMKVHLDCYGGEGRDYCKGAFEPDIRNIDPTIKMEQGMSSETGIRRIHDQLYKFKEATNLEWLGNDEDIPKMNELLNMSFKDNQYILLNGQYIWDEEKKIGVKKYQNPQKDMWIQINCYIVKKYDKDDIIRLLQNKDFMGRWMPEPNNNYTMFNKEYYWSEAERFFSNPYYCGEEWADLSQELNRFEGCTKQKPMKMLISSQTYATERQGDLVGDSNYTSWYKPCKEIFNGLNMQYGKEDAVLYDNEGRIICFDSKELIEEEIGFFIKKDIFMKYIKENDYEIFWTLLAEKRIISNSHDRYTKYDQPHFSGIYTVDENGNITGDMNKFYD